MLPENGTSRAEFKSNPSAVGGLAKQHILVMRIIELAEQYWQDANNRHDLNEACNLTLHKT